MMGDMDAPQRVSVLAVSSLVFGVLCCIPVVGLIAIILGASGLIRIREAEGRLGGKTLAIVGIVLGMLGTLGWLAVGVGVRRGYASAEAGLFKPTYAAMGAMDKQDWPKFRMLLEPKTSDSLSDADLETFRDAYQAQFGAFKGPASLGSVLMIPQPPGTPAFGGAVMPVPTEFQQGPAEVMLVADGTNTLGEILTGRMTASGGAVTANGHVTNIAIVGDGSKHLWLVDPMKSPKAKGPAGSRPPQPAPTAPSGPAGSSGTEAPGTGGR